MFSRTALFIFALVWLPASLSFADQHTLEAVIEKVHRTYSTVSHMKAETFQKELHQKSDVLLLDVREEIEYRVSRIPGAVRVDPHIWTNSFMKKFGEAAKGKKVVFYCSVGVRSSRLATRVQEGLKKAGASGVHNLSGGIFYWHGMEMPLVNNKGQTDRVHPFNPYWGQLVSRRQAKTTQ